ncbi:hypothetical protein JHK82_027531 [Glycine max]|uniref:Uncharacterized protein n=2 Tax=Glycine subgen. Soja TaxID=1462606 RepID=K7LIR1_SOYBN|nr:hypothetical protein JHK87_027422 [Glycine soja]KAG5003517.1 hypothetical protein JHK86_027656 [Glycine max]KAG5126696.1 hypothetical protein JHK82_027531 [Glycine max]KAG5151311.1 hypothetical protein JHK84_027783 [Glycine max]KAH1137540.1 hypothetical protein GYH30_027515 [Glycine max]
MAGDVACFNIKANIIIRQSETGNLVNDKPEWKVSISNICVYTQSQVKFNCNRFQTTKDVNPSILSISDDVCLLKNDKGISRS